MDKVEFLMEEKKLQETIELINNEVMSYLEKRKYITDYILDYRKKVIEEFKDDEDKIIEYFDHERYVKEEAFKTIDRRLKELTILKESPYFGRVDFREEDETYIDNIYIGRFGVTPESSYEPAIIDWRAPVASLFYNGTLGSAEYKSPEGSIKAEILGRRQFIIKKEQLKGMFDSAVDVKDEILQMVLSSNSENKLKDIIMTIQAEQDEIIRKDRRKSVIVNGVAGSGKTTIALHRVAYLLYNNREALQDKVLILGPNNIFMEYISSVLPSLGEVGVNQDTFVNFAINEIGLEENIYDLKDLMEAILAGNKEIINDIKRKISIEYIDELDNLINNMEESYFNVEDVKYFGEIVVTKEEIEELINKYYKDMPLFRRSEKIKRILLSKVKNKRDEKYYELMAEIEKQKKELSPEKLELEENNIEFNRRLRIREIVREVMNSRAKIDECFAREDIVAIYNRFNNNKRLNIYDLAPILYLMIKLENKKYNKEVRHIVIDEAQDYTYIQFKVIRDLTGCNNFTIVGDENQRLIKFDEKPAMLDLDRILPEMKYDVFNLEKSYRSTKEIMEYANNFLEESKIVPLVRNGEKVEEYFPRNEEEMVDNIVELIKKFQDAGLESIAVVTRGEKELKNIAPLLKKKIYITTFDKEEVLYRGGNVIIPSYYAKGLEFDGVIIVDMNDDEKLINYIMSTRALHRLAVIK